MGTPHDKYTAAQAKYEKGIKKMLRAAEYVRKWDKARAYYLKQLTKNDIPVSIPIEKLGETEKGKSNEESWKDARKKNLKATTKSMYPVKTETGESFDPRPVQKKTKLPAHAVEDFKKMKKAFGM